MTGTSRWQYLKDVIIFCAASALWGDGLRLKFWRVPIFALAVLSACTLPRGAALQRETLAGADDEYPEIAPYPVTRNFLPLIATWPATGAEPFAGWIAHANSVGSRDLRSAAFDTVDLTVLDGEMDSLLASEQDNAVDIQNLRDNASGQIFVPSIGYLRVADRTPDRTRELVERKMAAIVPSAQVQLLPQPCTRGSVQLVGGVGDPQPCPMPETRFNVPDLIDVGGSPSGSRNTQVRPIRSGHTYASSFESLFEDTSGNTILRGGDKVALEQDDRYFRTLGASGIEQLVLFEEDSATALDVLPMMGGTDDRRADLRGVLVLRDYPARDVRLDGTGTENTRTLFSVDLTTANGLFNTGCFEVFPGDTVMATEPVISSAESAVVQLGAVIGLSNRVN